LLPNGKLPEAIIVELGDTVSEGNFFRFNVSPAEAAKLPIVNGCIPFDVESTYILDSMPEMCSRCFAERRKALESATQS
jgi:hypothetical protein